MQRYYLIIMFPFERDRLPSSTRGVYNDFGELCAQNATSKVIRSLDDSADSINRDIKLRDKIDNVSEFKFSRI